MDTEIKMFLNCLILAVCMLYTNVCSAQREEHEHIERYKIEGKVIITSAENDKKWISETRILVDGGDFLGFIKEDGSFTINNVPTGSFIVEVSNPQYEFKQVRVDINSNGRIRARELDLIRPKAVKKITYPLRLRAKGKAKYFEQRDDETILSYILSPTGFMMLAPLVMFVIVSQLGSGMAALDPEQQREMQNGMNQLNPYAMFDNIPELSEILTRLLGGGKPTRPKKKTTRTAKPGTNETENPMTVAIPNKIDSKKTKKSRKGRRKKM